MISALAYLFRKLNSQLLYTQGIANALLKVSYLMSVYSFKLWTRKRRASKTVTISNFDGHLKFTLDISKSMGASLYWTGFHEFNEMRFLNRFLAEDFTFVDVGANQGEYAVFAARRLSNGRVLAFEPTSFFYERLVHNAEQNGLVNVQCFQLGLSDSFGEALIYYNSNNSANHEGLASLFPVSGEGGTETIRMTTLDEIVRQHKVSRVDFIKVDVEGAEWAVLKGAEQVLRKFRPGLMVELNKETAGKAGYAVDDMIAWLESLGYHGYGIARDQLVPLVVRPFSNAVFITDNR